MRRPVATSIALLLGLSWFAMAVDGSQWEEIDPDDLANAPVVSSWDANIGELALRYHLVDLRHLPTLGYAQADHENGRCNIFIDVWLQKGVPRLHKKVVLHEVGHCIDLFELGLDHNGFTDEGCIYGEYYCDPAEGYAETWRYAYLAQCGTDLESVGYRQNGKEDAHCDLPDARAVTPQLVSALYRFGRLREADWFIGLR